MKQIIFIFLVLNFNFANSQTIWKSNKYNYQVEIPKGFQIKQATGANVDFKVGNIYGNSIVIVVKKLPIEYKNQTIYQVLGSLDDFANDWIDGSKEIFNTPKLIKYGKTKINNYDAFWLDYTTDNDTYYYKNYSIKKGDLIFAVTFFSTKEDWNYYSAIWFRFKEKMKL
jgi:hypothetical protein